MIANIGRYVTATQANAWYALTIALLAGLSLIFLAYEYLYSAPEPALVTNLQQLDLVIAYIFLTDFFLGLGFNNSVSRRGYLKHNWLNLISSIPISNEITQALRILRVIRATRIIRASMNLSFARRRLKEGLKK